MDLHSGATRELPLTPQRYRAAETLRDGRKIEVRALQRDDETQMLDAVSHTSAQSRYRRFFGVKKDFSAGEKNFFLNVDFSSHVALVATLERNSRGDIIGGARYIVVEPGTAEVAFMVVDEFQGQGAGTVLLRHLVSIARSASLKKLVADVLPENTGMLRVFQNSGLRETVTRSRGVVRVELDLNVPASSAPGART
jgi:RimJ/RimL family protein N-acetyltransferase